MRGLLLKDFYCLKQYQRQYFFMLLFFMVIAITMKSPIYVIFMGFVLGINMIFTTLALDETSGFAYFITTPVGRKEIVREKYGLLLLEMIVVMGVSVLTGCVVSYVAKLNVITWLPNLLIGVDFYLIMISILIPTVIKWKVEKGRLVIWGLLLIPTLAIIGTAQLLGEAAVERMAAFLSPSKSGIFIFLLSLILMGISYRISVRVFEKKEF